MAQLILNINYPNLWICFHRYKRLKRFFRGMHVRTIKGIKKLVEV